MFRKKPITLVVIALFALALIISGCSAPAAAPAPTPAPAPAPAPAQTDVKYAKPDMIVSADQLKGLLEDPKVRILDIRDPKIYLLGHIKGALNVWRPDYEAPAKKDVVPGRDLTGMICDQKQWETLMGKLGISNDTRVIIYDDNGLYDSARVYWMLNGYGHTNMQILNGGYDVWKAQGGATALGTSPEVKAATYTAKPFNMKTYATLDQMKTALNNKDYVILDTRELKEFTGEELKKGAYRKGRIPGSEFVNWKESLNADKTIKSPADLEKLFKEAGITKDKTVIPYCQSAVRSANLWFVLTMMGYDKVLNYDGSWIEWSIYDELPLETGEEKK